MTCGKWGPEKRSEASDAVGSEADGCDSLAIWLAFDREEVHFLLVLPAASSDPSTWSWETLIRSQGTYEAFLD
ncbi:hypothetical protein P5673_032118, partial [Acropora cervicornis]